MKQNDNNDFVLPCLCPSNATGFIVFKRYGTYTLRIYASDEEIPQMAKHALCVHLKGNSIIFADFDTKQ